MRWVLLAAVLLVPARGRVARYYCVVTPDNEVLCRDPATRGLFRPERRFSEFVIELPAL